MTAEIDPIEQGKKPLRLRSIDSLLSKDNSFFVPAYQRGYRWKPSDVQLLIEDLMAFQKEESKKNDKDRCPFYSLQVVVLKDGPDRRLEVIDGQQRLTTVLIILQALYAINGKSVLPKLISLGSTEELINDSLYSIKYETRVESGKWLADITAAYFKDHKHQNTNASDALKEKNSDYYHFVDAFQTAMDFLGKLSDDDRNTFAKTLRQETRFIWYNISEANEDVSDRDVDIFNRLNATKINLNNAELIKALFLQEGNFLNVPTEYALRQKESPENVNNDEEKMNILYERDQMAIDWDNLEKQLQEPSFWYFVYSSNHPYMYDTRIEYLFDLIMGKTADDKDNYYFTFNKYYTRYVKAGENKLKFVRESWKEVQEMFLLLQEWCTDKVCYHYIGYLLEYGKKDDGSFFSIPFLKGELAGLKKDVRESTLKSFIKESLKNIKSDQLVHSRAEMTQILFLFNIELELRRKNATSRFSFAEYKTIKETIGWDQEHVASHVDYEPQYDKRVKLAGDLLEYFTGVPYSEDEDYKKQVQQALPQDKEAGSLCVKLMDFFNEKITEEVMKEVYDAIFTYFESDNKFREGLKCGKKVVSEKDFIWNFVLLNSKTNRSYGNHIYPVKRQRIQRDENEIYTPIGTRSVFEKAYSTKLTNMIAWGRDDAISYWDKITKTLTDFLPEGFTYPSYITVD